MCFYSALKNVAVIESDLCGICLVASAQETVNNSSGEILAII